MVHVIPTWAEARVIGIPTGIGGMIGLANWAEVSPNAHLWDKGWFQAAIAVLGLLAVLGFYGFIAHWKVRSIPPVLVAATAIAIFFRLPPVSIWALLLVTFLVTAYLISPDRQTAPTVLAPPNDAQRERILQSQREQIETLSRDRENLLLEVAAVKTTATSTVEPLIKGEILRFEALEQSYISEWAKQDLSDRLGRAPTFNETMGMLLHNPQGPWYIAWLQLEALQPSKATDWAFTLNHKDGAELACELYAKNWGPPKAWSSNIKFDDVTEVQNSYLQSDRLYNVLLHVQCTTSEGSVNMNSFKVRFLDKDGAEVICTTRARL